MIFYNCIASDSSSTLRHPGPTKNPGLIVSCSHHTKKYNPGAELPGFIRETDHRTTGVYPFTNCSSVRGSYRTNKTPNLRRGLEASHRFSAKNLTDITLNIITPTSRNRAFEAGYQSSGALRIRSRTIDTEQRTRDSSVKGPPVSNKTSTVSLETGGRHRVPSDFRHRHYMVEVLLYSNT